MLAESKEEVERESRQTMLMSMLGQLQLIRDGFEYTPECKDLVHHFMTAGGEQLVKRIAKTHLEWDISFLRHSSNNPALEDHAIDEAQTLLPPTEEGLQCVDPSKAAG
ncbi:hypothetical protein Adt_32062 [Abeliophyllum distichum]|uniref:Uncharacterized protein n=1 Tax=Abeliophyllum distichum TaxID=126358 RepID=A0ABD1RGP8_9LAMI